MDTPLTPNSYDAIVSMSALHHLPLTAPLSRLATAVRPGGTLAAVALARRDLPHDLPIELAATTWHHVLGFALTGTRYRVDVLPAVNGGEHVKCSPLRG